MCSCERDQLCDACRAEAIARLYGVCCSRADQWLLELPRSVRARRWPGRTEKVMAIARRKLADLTRDPRLLDELATDFATWAEKRWSGPGAQARKIPT